MIQSKITPTLLTLMLLLSGCIDGKKKETNDPKNSDSEERVITLKESMVISENSTNIVNKHFICEGTHFEAIKVVANNTIIKNSSFKNCDVAINIQRANHVEVTGNRFENIGSGVILNGEVNDANIVYNEFVRVGERDCTRAMGGKNCNVIAARELTQNSTFAHNRIDNRRSNSIYMEDYISVYTGYQNRSSNIKIEKNLLVGSSVRNASNHSGGCIVLDGQSANNTISHNQCYNVSGYGIAAASANHATIKNNRVYITKEHHDSIKRDSSGRSHVYAFGATAFYQNICASNISFIENEGYAYHDAYANHVKVAWMPCLNAGDKNSYPDGTYPHNIQLRDNDFKSSDPHWTIPENIFSNLGKNYYSSNH
jgi:hypothetical protein